MALQSAAGSWQMADGHRVRPRSPPLMVLLFAFALACLFQRPRYIFPFWLPYAGLSLSAQRLISPLGLLTFPLLVGISTVSSVDGLASLA